MRGTKRLEGVRHKIAVMSGKGGVGKSTIAANLALALAMHGSRTGLLDCDMHGPTIPRILGIEGERPSADGGVIRPITVGEGLRVMSIGLLLDSRDSPVIWRGPLKMKAIEQLLGDVQWGELDYLVIDLPPGTGDEPLSVVQLVPNIDGAVVVTTPQDVALLTVRRAIRFAEKVKLPVIGLIENMSGFICPHCGGRIDIFRSGGGERLASEMGIRFLGRVPLDPSIVESGEDGRPFVLGSGKSAKIFKDIVNQIEKYLGEKGGAM